MKTILTLFLLGLILPCPAMADSSDAALARWVIEHARPADEYFLSLFGKHQIVIFGEAHNIKEHKDFILQLIPRLYREAGVRAIGWEFSKHTNNAELEKLVTAPEFDRAAALQFAREQDPQWNSKEHWDMIEAVWRLNRSLKPDEERMRLIGLDRPFDDVRYAIVNQTEPPDSPERKRLLDDLLLRDRTMAEIAEKEIIAKGRKGLLFVGRCHDFTHYKFPPEIAYGREIMGNLLFQKHGERVFQVFPEAGKLSAVEKIVAAAITNAIGFDLYASPFANFTTPKTWRAAPGVPAAQVARGYLYFGPAAALHSVTPIKGFVTEEMFQRCRRYYEIEYERSFPNAKAVDEYLQKHRWW